MGDYRVKVHTKDETGVMPLTVVVDKDDREAIHRWLRRAVRNKLILTWSPLADEEPRAAATKVCPACAPADAPYPELQESPSRFEGLLCMCGATWPAADESCPEAIEDGPGPDGLAVFANIRTCPICGSIDISAGPTRSCMRCAFAWTNPTGEVSDG